MATAFKQVVNNAQSLVATAPSPATSGTSLVVTTGDGVKFPVPGNGFWATIWNAVSFPDPSNDVNREIVLVTAISTDTFTITRTQQGTSARTVVIGDAIRLLWTAQNDVDKNTAINALENVGAMARSFEAVVAASGGDYTTLGAALAAGKYSIFVRRGTYAEGAALNTYTAPVSKSIFIMGEDKENTIIQLGANTAQFFSIKGTGAVVTNLTIQLPNLALASNQTGWVRFAGNNATFNTLNFIGANTNVNGCAIDMGAAILNGVITNVTFGSGMPNGGCVMTNSSKYARISNNYWLETRDGISGFQIGDSSNSAQYVTFSNNELINTNTALGSSHKQVVVTRCNYFTMIGNQFNCSANTGLGYCIYLDPLQIAYLTMTGNYVEGGQANSGYGLYTNTANGNLSSTIITGNFISGSTRNTLGISGAVISGNSFNAAATSEYGLEILTGTGRNVITGNIWSGSYGLHIAAGCTTTSPWIVRDNTHNNGEILFDATGNVQADQSAQFFAVAVAGATTTLDMRKYRGFKLTLAISTTIAFTDQFDMTQKPNGMEYNFEIIQNATGGFTVAWPATVIWPGGTTPVITATASKRDFVKLVYDQAAGKYYGYVTGQNY